MMSLILLLSMLAQAPPAVPVSGTPLPVSGTNAIGGRVFRVASGLAFESIAASLKPGDEVVLERGIHAAFTLTDLRGEPDRPIVIRGELGEEPARYPYVKATDRGIRLVRPRHVILRDFMVGNGTGPLVSVEGDPDATATSEPWEANVKLFGLRLAQTLPAEGQCGLLLRGVSRVDASNMSFRGWNVAAVAFDRSRQCSLQQAVLDPGKGLPQRVGVVVGAGCRQIVCALLTFGPRLGTVFRIGACEGAPADVGACSEVLVSRCSVPNAKCFLSLGAADKVRVEFNTVTDPSGCVWRAEPECGPPTTVQFERNLFCWTPGGIARLCDVPREVPPESVQLLANLWYSAEIPGAFEEIGRPFGVELAPQVLDVDPRVEPSDASPREPKALGFGWRAGLSTPATVAPTREAAGGAAPPPAKP